jgi:uncharacterized protein (TIGR02118 family)
MIRLAYYLRRKPGMSADAFRRYWRERHGPLVASCATDLRILRYVQTHRVVTPLEAGAHQARDGMEPAYDGVADLWFASEDDVEAALTTEEGRAAAAALLEDEATFIDLPHSPLWLCHEYPQVNPSPEDVVATERSGVLRVAYPLRHLDALTEAEARRYWLTHHGPIVRRGAVAAGTLCYRQVHRADHPLDAALREARGTVAEPYLGTAEAWFDTGRAPGTDEARRANASFVEDERNFIDFGRSTLFFGKELVFVDRRGDW